MIKKKKARPKTRREAEKPTKLLYLDEGEVKELIERYGWAEMGRRVPIRCFLHDPSVKSSLTFLRKTPWARERVEGWYIAYKDR
jgi:uncharacterized protein (DUF2132 family)